MPGGELNLKAFGQENIMLNGNPTKTFFNIVYSKYTNFGLQKFRIDYSGLKKLRLTEPSTFSFKIPRVADMLMDTYLCVTLPDIWSPIYHPTNTPTEDNGNKWVPYEFNWIRNIGAMMIKEITFTCGGQLLQKFSGHYLSAMIDRDFSSEKKKLFAEMSGDVPEVNDLANCHGRINTYPSAYYMGEGVDVEPSFRSRQLCIPINAWYMLNSKCAFPLIALQYNVLEINVTIRPIQELFIVRDVFDIENDYPYIQPDFTKPQFGMYRFLQQPPSVNISPASYENTAIFDWNADVHLIMTCAFLSEEERRKIALTEQVYLVKDVIEYSFDNIVGSTKVKLNSTGMVANWMWFFQRNDAFMRNQWSNYTNWPYHFIPSNIDLAPQKNKDGTNGPYLQPAINGPGGQPKVYNSGIYITGEQTDENQCNILMSMGIVLDGIYRENSFPLEVYDFIEKYTRTPSYAKRGIYCYNFCLNTSPFEYQPSGAMNLGKFKLIELEITTIPPSIDAVNSNFKTICDENGVVVGFTKQNWRLYDYTFMMTLFEERYNVLTFIGGNCGMLNAR
jgi:hypothetical protein